MLPITNCRRCGRIFNMVRREICPTCVAEEDKAFQAVRAYLKTHRDASMAEVTEKTGVESELIVEMIRDGRLILRDNPNLSYACERCGSATQAGRYCANCSRELSNVLDTAATSLKTKISKDSANDKGFYSRN